MANNTGVFFNVNDNDGIPLVGVSTNGNVSLTPFYGNTGIGITNPVSSLDVDGPIISRSGAFVVSTFSSGGSEASWANPISVSNVDHIWHNDGLPGVGNTWGLGGEWNFVSDSTYKADGNSWIRAGGFANTTQMLGASYPLQISGNSYISGSLGIGTTNPTAKLDVNGTLNVSGVSTISVNSTSDALRITQTGSGNAFKVEDSTNPDATPFVVNADGRVSIGTNTSSSTWGLELYGVGLQISNSTEGSGSFSGLTFSYEPASNGNYIISWSKPLLINSGSSDVILQSSANNVGIGTTNPTAKLDVVGDVNISGILTASKVASGIPQNTKTSAYTLQKSDVGKYISISSGGVTVPSGIFSEGDVISVYNNSASNQTITQGISVTMYISGTSVTGNRTLSQRGLSTILCVGSNTFIIGGAGLS